ncbi:hypothetical protein UG55_1006200 [Frankia sp. EI5c]|uniref:hypothetical protein n=1 Tax=Frankia sp. EI5c TaxID=683316 RepID=UPI0007C31C02|nr:hypothetical protein [Frankia sp. EI5c]OAA28227.1 hypothetical protein UG55_1006200 [Frankia sp. EI5c]
MDSVEFRLETEPLPSGKALAVCPYVNGVDLRELVRAVELPFAEADRQPDLAGSYAGLHDPGVRWPSRHFLGEPAVTWFGDGDTALLGCVCGDAGCWPLTARVDITVNTVIWRHFRTGHRSWDLGGLGPFHFDALDYRTALRQTGSASG